VLHELAACAPCHRATTSHHPRVHATQHMHSSAVRTGARPVDGAGPYRLSGAVRATTGTCNARTNPAHADAHWCGVPSVGVVAHSPVRHSSCRKEHLRIVASARTSQYPNASQVRHE
jgi:hypothetical protein